MVSMLFKQRVSNVDILSINQSCFGHTATFMAERYNAKSIKSTEMTIDKGSPTFVVPFFGFSCNLVLRVVTFKTLISDHYLIFYGSLYAESKA